MRLEDVCVSRPLMKARRARSVAAATARGSGGGGGCVPCSLGGRAGFGAQVWDRRSSCPQAVSSAYLKLSVGP